MKTQSSIVVSLLALAASFSAQDAKGGSYSWPQWRGPDRTGVSRETAWSAEGKEEPLWKRDVGLGYSCVSVADGRLLTLGWDEARGGDTVFCLDPVRGTELWSYTFPAARWDRFHGGGTLTTPSIDGDHVFVMNREGKTFAFQARDGRVLWRRNVKEDHDLEYPTWGFSASPLVLEDMLVLNVGKVIALDKKTGEPRWTTEEDFGHAYSTPRDFEWNGKACLAVFDGNGLVVLDRKDGRKLGFHEWKTRYDINAATPIVIGDGIFISSGMGRGAALLAVADDGIDVVWENREMNTKLSGCVLVDDHLYGFDEAVLKCMDLEGNELWAQRGLGDGCLSGAADRLLVMSADGELIVVAADPSGYRELSRTKVLEGGEYWTKPVLVNGLIYCRNSLGQLACLDHRGAN